MTQSNYIFSKLFILSSVLVLSVFIPSCNSEKQDKQMESTPDSLAESIDPQSLLGSEEELDCPAGAMVICNQGLAFAPIGYPIADLHVEEIEGVTESDSLDHEMGYVRLNRRFNFAQGSILLEGEAHLESGATDEILSASKLSRIRIEMDGLKTPDGVHSGMDMQSLRSIYQDDEISIISFASIPEFMGKPKYEFLILNPEKYPNITYLVPDPGHQLYKKFEGEDIYLSQLPSEIKLSSIVVSI